MIAHVAQTGEDRGRVVLQLRSGRPSAIALQAAVRVAQAFNSEIESLFVQDQQLLDLAQGEAEPQSVVEYALFVTFFPHLIAGPILHHREMMPQFLDKSYGKLRGGDMLIGLSWFVLGMAKKCVLADRLALFDIARVLAVMSEKARAGKLKNTEMQGGTFTISSLGGIGGTAFTPIINAPEVAILGVSRSAMKPVFRDGAFVPRLILPLSLSYDHRVIDGATAARFTTYLAESLANVAGLIEAVL